MFEVTSGFSARQHVVWIHHRKSIEGETFTRGDLSAQTRKLSLSLKDQQRVIAIPVSMMAIAYIMMLYSNRRKSNDGPEKDQ